MSTGVVIEPLDVLLFRDGKPFSAGADHLARSVFPPFPSTFAGFIRSRLYLEAGKNWKRAREMFGNLGGPHDHGDFRLRGAFLRKQGFDYVPVPGDCVRTKAGSGAQLDAPLAILSPVAEWPVEGLKTNYPDPGLRPLRPSAAGAFEAVRGFVSITELFRTSLLGETPTEIAREEDFVQREPRIAIGLDRAGRVAGDQLLYAVEFLRLKPEVGFLAAFDGVRWPGRIGLDTFGGERRPVRWNTEVSWTSPASHAVAQRIADTRRLKLVLLTPAIFDQGWQPGRRFAEILHNAGLKIRLIAAAVDRPAFVGGFDLAAKRPKPIRTAVPAGSVYFYEIEDGDPLSLMSTWDLQAVSDLDWEAGMGISAVGTWTTVSASGGEIMNRARFLFLHAQTALHPGSGASLGVVDMPVQRERHTDWPTIPGSSLKGVLRDACRGAQQGKSPRDADSDPKLAAAFGPITESAHEHAGALALTDARILAFPVRSLCGVFAWITCPAVVERLARDLAASESSLSLTVSRVDNEQVLCSAKSPLLATKDSIILEEFDFSRVGEAPPSLVEFISKAVHQSTASRIREHLAVLSDDDFGYFVRRATEVVARVGLDYNHKTARRGALFYQEFLPAETVFYALVIASPSRREGDTTDADGILQYVANCLPPVLQVGGDESIGKGICFARLEGFEGK